MPDQLFDEIDAALRPLGSILWLKSHLTQGGESWRRMKQETIDTLDKRIDLLTSLRDRLVKVPDEGR